MGQQDGLLVSDLIFLVIIFSCFHVEPDRRSVLLGKDGHCRLASDPQAPQSTDVNFEFIGFSVSGQVIITHVLYTSLKLYHFL